MLALLPLGRQAIARQVAAVSIANVSVASSTFHVQMLQVSNYATSIRKTTKDTAAASTTVDVEVTVAETTKKSASTKASKKKVKATGDKDQAVNGNEKAAEKVAGEKKSKMKKKAITIMDGQTRQDDIAPVTKKKAKGGKLGMKKTKESKKEEPVSVKISPKQSVSKADAPSRTSSPSSPSLPFAPSTPPAEIDALSNYVNNPKLMRAMPTKGDNISINGSPQFEDSEGTRGQIKQQEKTAVSKTSKMSQTISAAMSPAIEAKTETSSARTLPTPAANSLASPPLRVSMLLSTKPANLKQLKPTLTGQRVALGSKGEGLVNPPPPQQQQQQQQQQEQRPSYPRTSRPSPPDPMKDPNSEEYKERYQAKKKFWTSIMVGVPVVVVTTWMLADRFINHDGKSPKERAREKQNAKLGSQVPPISKQAAETLSPVISSSPALDEEMAIEPKPPRVKADVKFIGADVERAANRTILLPSSPEASVSTGETNMNVKMFKDDDSFGKKEDKENREN